MARHRSRLIWALALALLPACVGGTTRELERTYVLAEMPTARTEPAVPAVGQAVLSWQSSGWTDTWLEYPGAAVVTVEHGLGRVPMSVETYLAFTPNGAEAAVASGDLARIVSVDESQVVLWNRTEETYFLRVVVR